MTGVDAGRVHGRRPGLAAGLRPELCSHTRLLKATDEVLDVDEALDVMLEVEKTFADVCVVVGFGRIPL